MSERDSNKAQIFSSVLEVLFTRSLLNILHVLLKEWGNLCNAGWGWGSWAGKGAFLGRWSLTNPTSHFIDWIWWFVTFKKNIYIKETGNSKRELTLLSYITKQAGFKVSDSYMVKLAAKTRIITLALFLLLGGSVTNENMSFTFSELRLP